MDSATGHGRVLGTLPSAGRLSWKTLAAATFLVGLGLGLAQVLHGAPRPLVVTIGTCFLACAAIGWVWTGVKKGGVRNPLLRLALAWIGSTALLLGFAYGVDRSGWVWFRLTGYNIVAAEQLLDQTNLSAESFVSQNPVFTIDPKNPQHLILKKSVYEFPRTIVIPAGLSVTIEPGTVLRFHPGRSLISYSAVIARGTEREPILFTAHRPWLKWGVVGVVRGGRSEFEHVRFEAGRHAFVNDIEFRGTLSLVETDVRIAQSQFEQTHGKDAVYIREAHADISESVFRRLRGDGLDFDGGSGTITQNEFIDCSDGAIDLSGDYNIQVTANRFFDGDGGRIAVDKDLEEIRALNTFGYSRKKSVFPFVRAAILE